MRDNREVFTETQEIAMAALIQREEALRLAAAKGHQKAQTLLPKVQVLLSAHLRKFKFTSSYFGLVRSELGEPLLAFSADVEVFRELKAVGPFSLN